MNERFWSKVFVWHHIHCWAWMGCTDPAGYGRFSVGNKSRLAHRIAYEDLVGPIPDGLVIDHRCYNPSCCNPFHMEVVTRAENTRRARFQNTRKTECKRGHPFDEANTMRHPDGRRECRECANEASRQYRHANREAINARRRARRALA